MKLEDIGVVVLSHGRRDKLEKSLKSYEENGLTDMVGDNFIFFNQVCSDDISLIENDYKKFEWGGHPVNCGIGWGMVKSITESVFLSRFDMHSFTAEIRMFFMLFL